MKDVIEKLREFHRKHDFPLDQNINAEIDEVSLKVIRYASYTLLSVACKLEHTLEQTKSPAIRRVHFMVEELGETLQALAAQDEEELLDGLADSIFVDIGTAEAYGLPIYEALIEICNSNLTKATRNALDLRLRDKGSSYIAPDLKRVLNEWRNK